MTVIVWALIAMNVGLGTMFLNAAAREWMEDDPDCVYGFAYVVVFYGSATFLASGALG